MNHLACTVWAVLYERYFGKEAEKNPSLALAGGACISALAYATDYHVVPRRLTPGFELCLAKKSFPVVYIALGLGLALRSLLNRSQARSHEDEAR